MTDRADDHAAYREAMARAEAASGIERDPETGVELNGIESLLNGQTPAVTEQSDVVPVQASDQQLISEPAVQTTEATSGEKQEQEQQTETQTVEELQAELAAAHARIEEQKTMIGRQSAEVGETRERMDELEARLARAEAARAAESAAPPVIPITRELIDENPALAVQAAFDQKNEAALEVAWKAWDEEGDGAAKLWLAERRAEQREAALQAQIEQTRQELAQIQAPLEQSAAERKEQENWKNAFDTVRSKHPDIFQVDGEGKSVAETLIIAAGTKPEYEAFKGMLQNGDAAAKAAALEALYAIERLGDPNALASQLAEAAQQAEAEAAAARVAAGAVTGQTTVGQTTEPSTESEQEQQAYIARQKGKATLARGWTGRG